MTVAELARRLCLEAHPFLHTTGAAVPCGQHQSMAANLFFLVGVDGDWAWDVLARARIERIDAATRGRS